MIAEMQALLGNLFDIGSRGNITNFEQLIENADLLATKFAASSGLTSAEAVEFLAKESKKITDSGLNLNDLLQNLNKAADNVQTRAPSYPNGTPITVKEVIEESLKAGDIPGLEKRLNSIETGSTSDNIYGALNEIKHANAQRQLGYTQDVSLPTQNYQVDANGVTQVVPDSTPGSIQVDFIGTNSATGVKVFDDYKTSFKLEPTFNDAVTQMDKAREFARVAQGAGATPRYASDGATSAYGQKFLRCIGVDLVTSAGTILNAGPYDCSQF